jgi:imidazolonepropionase-like amidohydrolase
MLATPAVIDRKFRTYSPEDALAAAQGRQVSEAALDAWIDTTLASVGRQHERGVRLLSGTDALMTGVFHGPSVHWSMQFFSWAGIPEIEVLRMTTLDSAELVGAGAHLGSLEPGKIADVVLLDADPIEDIANTMSVWRVVKEGRVFDPATMRGQ